MSEQIGFEPKSVLMAYASGYFPMAYPEHNWQIYWHKPETRAVFMVQEFELKKRLQKIYDKHEFDLHINKAFGKVITACADRSHTWISEDIIKVYKKLNKMGYAYSFEAWQNNELVGGLYGVVLGRAFFGESMFHLVTNASKVTFVYLLEVLKKQNFILLDSQYINHFTKDLGAKEISDDDYMKVLQRCL
jgi:leucyl/phenylalanyl-tRNA--protein transferase